MSYHFPVKYSLVVVSVLILNVACVAQALQNQSAEQDPTFRTAVEKAFFQYEESLTQPCLHITPDWSRATKKLVGRTSFKGGKLDEATWSESVPSETCGQQRSLRALVVVRGGAMRIIPQLPGSSIVTPVLERDVRQAIKAALKVHLRSSSVTDHLDVVNTEVLGLTSGSQTQWREVWTIATPTSVLRVPIKFVPDNKASGTTFEVNPREITEVSSN